MDQAVIVDESYGTIRDIERAMTKRSLGNVKGGMYNSNAAYASRFFSDESAL